MGRNVIVMLAAALLFATAAEVQLLGDELIGYWDFEGEPKTLANYDDRSGNGYDMDNNPGTGFILGSEAFVGSYGARNRADKKSPGVTLSGAPKISEIGNPAVDCAVTITGWFNGNEDQGRDPTKSEIGAHLGLARKDGGKPTLGFGRRLSDGLFTARLSYGYTWSGNPEGYRTFNVSLARELGQSDWQFCAMTFYNGTVKLYTGGVGDADLIMASGTHIDEDDVSVQTHLYNPVYSPWEPAIPDPRQFGPFSVPGFGMDYTSAETKGADEVAIFDAALTDRQVGMLFDGAIGGTSVAGIVADPDFWKLHDGDANGDEKVDVFDLAILANHYGLPGDMDWEHADFNYDDTVDVFDLSILANNYGWVGTGGDPVPEPASAALLIVGAAGLIRRRRRR